MRTVSFVEQLEFDCKGSISSKAIAIADVDNDQVKYMSIKCLLLYMMYQRITWFTINTYIKICHHKNIVQFIIVGGI